MDAPAPRFVATYRRFSPPLTIAGEVITSDSAWGCTLRSLQTLLLNAAACAPADVDDASGAFGLAALLATSTDGAAAKWRGPWAAAHCAARAAATAAGAAALRGTRLAVAADGTICSSDFTFPALVLVPLRTDPGERLSAASAGALRALLALPAARGAVAGTPGHSLFVAGGAAGGAALLAVDPHREQPAGGSETYDVAAADVVRVLPTELMPSLALALRFESAAELEDCAAAARGLLSLSFLPHRAAAHTPRGLGDSAESADGWVDAASTATPPVIPAAPPRALRAGLRERVWLWLAALLATVRARARALRAPQPARARVRA
jgi:hypothetical protein